MNAHPVIVLFVMTVVVAGLAWWIGGIVHDWPRRERPRRRVTDGPRTRGDYFMIDDGVAIPILGPAQIAELKPGNVAGLPIWRLRQLFELSDIQLATHADVSRWLLTLGGVEKRCREVRRLLETKREELRLCGEKESDLPAEFVRPHGGDVA